MESSSSGATRAGGDLPPTHPVELCFENLKDEIVNVLQKEASYQELILKLETELSVYKRAYGDLEVDLKAAQAAQLATEALNAELHNECLALKKQDTLKPQRNRVVVLLDGDGAIFTPQLISQGQKGGHAAARRLSDATLQYLVANHEPRAFQLWVYVFFNKRGLLETFRRSGLAALIGKFEDFVMGFNQATERFLMVDVGSTKEAADTKLKVYLEDEIRLPETFKVVFGGCHDNGYVANLYSQITTGYEEKLVLLKGYTEMAAGIATLGLPELEIPDLFLLHKIGEEAVSSPPAVDPKTLKNLTAAASSPLSGNVNLGVTSAPRALDPNLAITKQKPPPCIAHYLKKGCNAGATCPFAHDYVLTAAHREEFRKSAKKEPCPSANKGKTCNFGESCCYGHVCPQAKNCFFLKRGKCKFKQANMHATPEAASS